MTAGPDPRRPTSTYRLQITADFDLFEATRRLPYLHDLGVDWVYLSPLLQAEPGSTHGYDVVAFDRVDASRGGAEGLAALSAEARRLGMGVLVDIVPNHVGVATPRPTRGGGTSSRTDPTREHAEAFDIDWDFGHGKLRIPVLGDDDEGRDRDRRRRSSATTSTASRWRPARAPWTSSTTSWSAGAAATPT